jgi:hypothetical protein
MALMSILEPFNIQLCYIMITTSKRVGMKSNTYPETEQGNGGTEIAGHSHNQCD